MTMKSLDVFEKSPNASDSFVFSFNLSHPKALTYQLLGNSVVELRCVTKVNLKKLPLAL